MMTSRHERNILELNEKQPTNEPLSFVLLMRLQSSLTLNITAPVNLTYDGILQPPTRKINYINMQHSYVDVLHNARRMST